MEDAKCLTSNQKLVNMFSIGRRGGVLVCFKIDNQKVVKVLSNQLKLIVHFRQLTHHSSTTG